MFSFLGGGSVVIGSGSVVTANNMAPMRIGPQSSVTVNGQHISGPCTVEVRSGKVLIDGNEKKGEGGSDNVEVTINIAAGDAGYAGPINLTAGRVEVTGNVTGTIRTTSGDISVGGNAGATVTSTSGDITITGDVAFDASSTSGDVTIHGAVGGNVSTISGDIRRNNRK